MKSSKINIPVLLLVGFLFCLNNCDKPHDNINKKVLVKIDNRENIYLDEFIKRAEYTIRPIYCNKSNYLHKKIVLNSLIAEKIMAMEEVNNNSKLLQSEGFTNYIKGRKEQAMRKQLYNLKAKKNVELSEEELNILLNNTEREFQVEYITFNDPVMFEKLKKLDNVTDDEFRLVFKEFYPNLPKIPTRNVSWEITENYNVMRALYYNDIRSGSILRPFQTGYREYLWLRVIDWKNNKAMFSPQLEKRKEEVAIVGTKIKQDEIWTSFVSKVMQNKSLVFDKKVLNQLGKIHFEKYFHHKKELKDELTQFRNENIEIFNINDEIEKGQLSNKKIFDIDGKEWSITELQRLIQSHPLVYRNRKMSAQEFPVEFKLALVDLMRDYYITQYAYENSMDSHPEVVSETGVWKDAYLAKFNKIQYVADKLSENEKISQLKIIEKYLNTYIDELQLKYFQKVEIDFDLFEAVKLTDIDLLTRNNFQPYKTLVPEFPVITTDYHFEYTRKMNSH